jgi:hypothetical protein
MLCQALCVRSTNSTAPKDGYVLELSGDEFTWLVAPTDQD